VLNTETGDDMLTNTGLTPHGYALTVTLFSVAYAKQFRHETLHPAF
jgi:hypothetical protein